MVELLSHGNLSAIQSRYKSARDKRVERDDFITNVHESLPQRQDQAGYPN